MYSHPSKAQRRRALPRTKSVYLIWERVVDAALQVWLQAPRQQGRPPRGYYAGGWLAPAPKCWGDWCATAAGTPNTPPPSWPVAAG